MLQRLIRTVLTLVFVALAAMHGSGLSAWGQDTRMDADDRDPCVVAIWRPGLERSARADVRRREERGSAAFEHEIARTRVMNVGLRSFSLCVSSTVEVAGSEFPSEPKTFSRDVAPQVESSQVVGEQRVTIDGREYPTQVINFATTTGTQKEANTIFFCKDTTPQMLKRVTTSVDSTDPDMATETTAAVTELNKMADILGEPKCTWAATTVIKMRDKTITIREVNCAEVPGELVSQITEEHDANGVLVTRKELELVGYGYGRPRRLLRHR